MGKEEVCRGESDASSGSTPLSSALEASSNSTFSPLTFDAREFMSFVEGEKLSEQEATALLSAIWEIVVAFVDLGFGGGAVQHALRSKKNVDGSGGSSGGAAPAVLSSMFQSESNKQSTSTHAIRRAEATEEP